MAAILLLLLGSPAFPHRLDEYLQATIISIEREHVGIFMRLIPGVAVSSTVLATIHAQSEAVISEPEQRSYAQRILGDLSLRVDNHRLMPKLKSVVFPTIEAIHEGTGEIQIELSADIPPASDTNRQLVFENHHQDRISAYLVNCLVPQDHHLRIVSQIRNQNQSVYRLNYVQEGAELRSRNSELAPKPRGWADSIALIARLDWQSSAAGN